MAERGDQHCGNYANKDFVSPPNISWHIFQASLCFRIVIRMRLQEVMNRFESLVFLVVCVMVSHAVPVCRLGYITVVV